MKKNIKNLLAAVRDNASHRLSWQTYEDALKSGLVVYEDTCVRQPNGEYGRGYVLTDAGRAAASAAEAVRSAARHAGNCRCPRCQVEHVRNGCRRILCPVCG
jgi:hypothetical protein